MLWKNIITVACLVVLAAEALAVVFALFTKKRAERIAFLRSFKKGKCSIIFITAIPLYVIGHIHGGENLLQAFFTSISEIIGLVVLKYDLDSLRALMDASTLYTVTVYVCFALVAINAVLFSLSLVGQRLWAFFQRVKMRVTAKERLYLFGNNANSQNLYKSDKKRAKIIVDTFADKDCDKLYAKKIAFAHTDDLCVAAKRIADRCKENVSRRIVVVHTGDEEKNVKICRAFIACIENATEREKENMFADMQVYVVGDSRYEAVYVDIVSHGYGCIHYVNKYQRIAMQFIEKYPFTQFMDDRHIDYDTALVKQGTDINVFMVGFGKTSQQIFLTSVANNQFLTAGTDGKPTLKQVHYHIFDRDEAENNKNLNHNYYRFQNECAKVDKDEYLPLPALPAKETYYHLDINDNEFYNRVRESVTRSEKDANFLIIAFGSDLENIDMAQKLVEKRREWGVENLTIFVKVRTWRKKDTLIDDERCHFIACEKDVYDIEDLLGDTISRMAKLRNEIYDLEYAITNENASVDRAYIEKNRVAANRKWYLEKSQLERESSLYCCLSLRSKLHMMGLDYCEKGANGAPALTEEEYMAIYAKGDMPDTTAYEAGADGKKIVRYTLDFPASMRRNLAEHEHLRWNSFMISKGMVPSSKAQILEEKIIKNGKEKYSNGRNYAVRRHGNLTTFDGLVAFRQMVAARDGVDEAEKDVIKYDYQLLDDAYWLLGKTGYKIVKR